MTSFNPVISSAWSNIWTRGPSMIGFVCALLPSFALNPLIIWYTEKRLKSLDLPEEDREEVLPVVRSGRFMANLERVLYVWAVMFNKYELIAGWLVLKGFSQWATVPSKSMDSLSLRHKQEIYNVYLEGNALSVILALLSGCFGLWLEFFL